MLSGVRVFCEVSAAPWESWHDTDPVPRPHPFFSWKLPAQHSGVAGVSCELKIVIGFQRLALGHLLSSIFWGSLFSPLLF